ncbi:MAG: IclR family transcriptional regulator [Alphaproteobacteria bacterium]
MAGRGRAGRPAEPVGSTGTIDRALDILEYLREAVLPQRLADISASTGLSPSSAHRILAALGRRAYVYRNPLTRRYSLGFQVFDLGETGSAMMTTTRRARPALVRLAADVGGTVFIGTRNGTRIALLDRADPPPRLARGTVAMGRYVDAHASAIGKVLLAWTDPAEVLALYDGVQLTRHTQRTIATRDALVDALAATRKRGHGEDDGELSSEVCGIAVPLINLAGEVYLAFWVVFPAADRPRDMRRVLARLKATEREVSEYQPLG